MPQAGVALFTMAWRSPEGERAESDPVLHGHVRPHALTAVLGLHPALRMDIVAEFADEENARAWKDGLSVTGAVPSAAGSPWLGTFIPFVSGARLSLEGRVVSIREDVTFADLERPLH